jgi:hypothetical protein
VNQIQQERDTRVSELEQKIEQMAPEEPVVAEVVATTTATSSAPEVLIGKEVLVTPVKETAPIVSTPTPTPAPVIVVAPVVQTSIDLCTNLNGVQSTLPNGYSLDVKGECVSDEHISLTEYQKKVQAELDNLMKPYLDKLNSSQCKSANKKLTQATDALRNFEPYQNNGIYGADSAEKNLQSSMHRSELSSAIFKATEDVGKHCPTSYSTLDFRLKYSDCTIVGNSVSCFSY